MQDERLEGVGVRDRRANVGERAGAGVSSPPDAVEALRRVSVFADQPEEHLRWFVENSRELRLRPGELLSRKGDPADRMLVYLEGEVHSRRDESMADGFVYIARAGDPTTEVSGKLPYSRMTSFPAFSRAVAPTRVLVFPERLFPEMFRRMPALAQRLVGVMSDRVREATKADDQRDKLTALGKLSAGLAHELNNPAAAARRAADELLGALEELRAADLRLCRHRLSPEQRAAVAEFEQVAVARAASAKALNSLERSDREEELSAWLEGRGVGGGWGVAPSLVEAGIGLAGLEALKERVGDSAFADVLARVGAQLSVARLAADIKASAGRISELVLAVKEYSYMDQAPLQEVDLHKGLDNTLLILKHKLKKKKIEVVRDYAPDLPRVTAFGSELNQVWTNLIDNAADALAEGGTLRVRTKREPLDVLVEIRDDGAGVPEDVKARIFEPFFTTKPVGEGTGLGLDAVLRIVRKHRGNVRFESKPGDTCFQVRLPLAPQDAGQGGVRPAGASLNPSHETRADRDDDET
jgi:signal transduction histidine kinase